VAVAAERLIVFAALGILAGAAAALRLLGKALVGSAALGVLGVGLPLEVAGVLVQEMEGQQPKVLPVAVVFMGAVAEQGLNVE
jgi:hypothetical protein